ncbi:NAD(P)-dependent alcohol dehydrogenase [Pseudochelatococcus sp. B33]
MSLPATMRAWFVRAYGGPDVLELRDMPLPRPGARDLLIAVQATTVSAGDRRLRAMDFPRGMGLIGRAAFGIRRPRRPILGAELTGIVVAAGAQASRFSAGDAVIAMTGARGGGHAEYALVREDGPVVPRPETMPPDVAAAIGFGGTTACDFLQRAGLRTGQRVLVIGASGTVGSALVQLAAAAGAEVTGVTSTRNLDLVRGLGAGAVIDYMAQDLARLNAAYDIVADAVGALTFASARPILAEGGRYLAIAGGMGDLLARPRGSRRCIAGPAAEKPEDLAMLVEAWANGGFHPLIDSVVPFTELPRGHVRADSGRKRGSIVVTLP